MQHLIYATTGTVIIGADVVGAERFHLQNDFNQTFHSKRPADPIIKDRFIYLSAKDILEDGEASLEVDRLIKHHDLRAVNFVVIKSLELEKVKLDMDATVEKLKYWDSHFKKNSFSGSLSLGIAVNNFEATIIDGFKVRGLNRLSLGLR